MKSINKPDITNEDPQYWEQVLDSHGLGRTKLGLSEDVLDLATEVSFDDGLSLLEIPEEEQEEE